MPSSFTTTCPHCNAAEMTFPIFGVRVSPERPIGRLPNVSVAAECQRCGKPIVAWLLTMRAEQDQRLIVQDAGGLMQRSDNVQQSAFNVTNIWPEPAATSVPADLPPKVERAFVAAEANYRMEECEDSAALMYRRALEVSISELHPSLTGSLAAKIRVLVDQHELPKPMGDWLHQVRLIGNDGAHDADGVDRDALADARVFTETALRYLFTLPAQIMARQTAKAKLAKAAPRVKKPKP